MPRGRSRRVFLILIRDTCPPHHTRIAPYLLRNRRQVIEPHGVRARVIGLAAQPRRIVHGELELKSFHLRVDSESPFTGVRRQSASVTETLLLSATTRSWDPFRFHNVRSEIAVSRAPPDNARSLVRMSTA